MIENLQQGNLPALVCEAVSLPLDRNVTLTELACYKIYGAALTEVKIKLYRDALIRDCRVVWSHPDGPVWLRQHVELMAKKQQWQFKPSCSPEDREYALAWFPKARRWLLEMRMQPVPEDASNEARETKSRLTNLCECDAIQMALEAAKLLEAAEAVVNDRSAHFYAVLTNEVATGRVVLKGIPVGAKDGQFMTSKFGDPPHKAIPQDYFNLPFVHNLYDNELEVNRFSSEEEIFHSIFNRTQRQFVESLVRYQDVRVPPEGVKQLLAALSGHSEPGQRIEATANVPTVTVIKKPGPKGHRELLKAAALAAFPEHDGDAPIGMSKKQSREAMIKAIKDISTAQDRRIAIPCVKTFSKYGF
jgi:hypothetical protein